MWYKDGEYRANPNIPGVANAHDTHYRDAGWIPVEDHRPESIETYERLVLDTEETVDGVRHRHYKAEHRPDAEIRQMREARYVAETDKLHLQEVRGDIAEGQWQAAMDAIREELPYEEEV